MKIRLLKSHITNYADCEQKLLVGAFFQGTGADGRARLFDQASVRAER